MDPIDIAVKRANRQFIDETNAAAIVANLTELREQYEARLNGLENEVASLKTLVENQSRVLGQTIARMMGSGSTESEG